MKNNFQNFTTKLFALICLLSISIVTSQNKKIKSKTAFGKTINTKNVNPKNGVIRCVTVEYEKYLQEKNPKRMTSAQFENWLAPLVKQHKAMRSSSESGGIITIPVVVHVIHSGQDIGVGPNISDAQVQSQITVLNQDYRKMMGTPGFNTNPVGADIQIEFALAQQDPNGNPTNGIDRVSFCQKDWLGASNDIDLNIKPTTSWNPSLYLNMWTVNIVDDVLGYAQFPDASGLGGLDALGGDANTDGVVASYNAFGSSTFGSFSLNTPYDKGRTMSHEVGHWLGLIHIWGDATCGNDFCADTPVHHDNNFGCPTVVNCDANGNEMVENYMDYTDDACMNIFTKNQKDRMVVIMNNAARRQSLKASTKNLPMALFANDAEVKVETNCSAESCSPPGQKITIYNRGTSILTAATINYNVNGLNNTIYNWTGNLTTHQSATFVVPVSSLISGTLIATVQTVNGGTDQRISNNNASGNYILPVAPSNYTFTNVVFRLQQDLYGSETSWSLKNGSGAIVYSGGLYTDAAGTTLPPLLTFNWTLASNQCYTFTLNDSFGDGICCLDGNGYYDIKSTNGGTIIKSGGAFDSSEVTLFTTNTLGNKEFKSSNEIYLYPNPTKGTINIKIPVEFGLPNSYTIYNYLGQSISKKEVSKESDLSVNTSALSNGNYFITIAKGAEKKTLQFIKE